MAVVLLCTAASYGCMATPVAADAFDEFRIPAHQVLSWDASLIPVADVARDTYLRRSTVAGGSLYSRLFWLSDSDPRRTIVTGVLSVSGNRTRQTDQFTSGYYMEDRLNQQRGTSESLSLGALQQHYQARVVHDAVVGSAGSASWTQNWAADSRTTVYGPPFPETLTHQSHVRQWGFAHSVIASVSGGLGRVRDASAVYEEQILEGRFRESGVRPERAFTRDSPAPRGFSRAPIGLWIGAGPSRPGRVGGGGADRGERPGGFKVPAWTRRPFCVPWSRSSEPIEAVLATAFRVRRFSGTPARLANSS